MLSRSASILVLSGTVIAMTATAAVQPPATPGDETIVFSADRVLREREDSALLAEGNVKAFFGGRSLAADKVSYDPGTDIVVAEGNVTIIEPDGATYFADTMELTGDLKEGVAVNFGALIGRQGRLAGATVVRRASGQNDLNNAAFTACSVCRADGSDKRPTWQVNARKVTQDADDKTIKFRDATIEAFGVPVMYTPYFQLPDPSVKRKSGLLPPSIGNSTRAGFEIEVPYYHVISDHQDFTFSPRYFEELGTLVKGEYRVRTHDGGAVVQAGFIRPKDSDILAPDDPEDLRWHLFAEAFKDLGENWRAALDIDVVSDRRYLRTYDIEPEDDLRQAIDALQPDRLENELSFTRRTGRSFTDVSAILFQSLREADNNDFIADALPWIRHEVRLPGAPLGGKVTLGGDFLLLHRPRGLDSIRLSGHSSWSRDAVTEGGHRLRGFAQVRADTYRYTDGDLGTEECRSDDPASYALCRDNLPRNGLEAEYTTSRLLPTVGGEWSFPLAKLTEKATFIIEPRVQAVISPDVDFSDDVFNEDSTFFQFDTVTLFDWNKATALDQWEDGQRLNVGIAASAFYQNGLAVTGVVGQQFRAGETSAFDRDTGLGTTTSDLVGEFNVALGQRFSAENQFRLDNSDGTLRRMESTLRSNVGRLRANVSYLRVETPELTVSGNRDEFLTLSSTYDLADRWLVGGQWRENLETGETTNRSLLLRYSDECTAFTISYRFDDTNGNGIEGNESLTFNVDLLGL